MSRWVRVFLGAFLLFALCGLCVAGGLGTSSAFDEGSHESAAVAVVYGDLEGPSHDSVLTDEADQEDGESATDVHDIPTPVTSRSDHPISPERVRSLRPDRPPRLAHRG